MYFDKIKKNLLRNSVREPLANEQGMVLVIALMIMVILSLLASFATTVSNTERLIAANDEIFIHNFYTAEAVCIEAGANLQAIPFTNLRNSTTWGTANLYPWLESAMPADPDPDIDGAPGTDLTLQVNWPMAVAPQVTPATTAIPNIIPAGSNIPDRIQYAAQKVDQELVPMGDPEPHIYALYGMYDVNQGAGKTYHGKILVSMRYKIIIP